MLAGTGLIVFAGNIRNALLRRVSIWILTGVVLYILLWFEAFLHHDYYLVPVFFAVLVILFLALQVVDQKISSLRYVVVPLIMVMCVVQTLHANHVFRSRYSPSTEAFSVSESYYTVEPALRALGISRFDQVVSVPDPSPNITLYYLNQPGHTECLGWFEAYKDDLPASPLKYAVVGNETFLNDSAFMNSLDTLLGMHHEIRIYRIKKP
jgi:hypothetical protein